MLAIRVLCSWRSLKWDLDNEADGFSTDPVKLAWGLLVLYFAAVTTASIIGFIGIARVCPLFHSVAEYDLMQ